MNRRSFFKNILLGVAGLAVVPRIITEIFKPTWSTGGIVPYMAKEGGVLRKEDGVADTNPHRLY